MQRMHLLLTIAIWIAAFAWITRAVAAARGLPTVANLLEPVYDDSSATTLTVIVPARNEQQDIAACLHSLLDQDHPHLQIIAVDDRSTDSTGAVMDALAASAPARLRVVHIAALPPGWLGKTHAMHAAAALAASDAILFTDADILFAPSALRRALVYFDRSRADHLVLGPTTLSHRWDEAALLSMFQIFGLWGARPWQISNPRARDAIGIGAFNLIRRDAYHRLGGFAASPMEIVEDLGLGRRVKRAGLAQRLAFGRGLVSLHWASGAAGIVNVLTKNFFSVLRYNIALLAFSCAFLAGFYVLPFGLLFTRGYALPAAIIVASMAVCYRLISPVSGHSAWNVLLAPFATLTFIYALLRSAFFTLRQGGVIWRGTFYPLAELRRAPSPAAPLPAPPRNR